MSAYIRNEFNEVFFKIIKSVKIDREPRGWEKASDHTPVVLELKN